MTTYQPSPTYTDNRAGGGEPTGWAGWTAFAAVMLGFAGFFSAIAGLTALFRDQVYLVTKEALVVGADYTTWGWVHLILGGMLLLACGSLLKGNMYGRVIAVVVATLSAIVNLAFLPAYPVWGVLVIAIDVLVIYAVTVHGRELKQV